MNIENLKYIEEYEREITAKLLSAKPAIVEQILNALSSDMFLNKLYKKFFKIAETLKSNGQEVNFYNIVEKATSYDQRRLLEELQKECMTTVNWRFYTTKIVDCYIDRLAQEAVSYKDVVKISEIRKKYNTSDLVMQDISTDAVDEVVGEYYDSMEHSIFTGYPNVDNIIGSFQKGDFIILAGATSAGKSLFMLNFALNIAKNQKKRVDIFSLEMQKKQLINRLVCAELGYDADKYRKHAFNTEEITKYTDYISEELPKYQININNTSRLNIHQVISAIKKSDAEVIFIDYLGLIRNPEILRKYDKISDISMELKSAALDSEKIIIALHQLSRAPKERNDKKPILSDLRDSGQIEQDADVVLFVYRPHYYYPDKPKDLMQVIVAKDRNGSLGIGNLAVNLNTQKVYNRIESPF